MNISFDNSYARLPERFFARLAPTAVPAPRLVCLNDDLARELGLDPAQLRTPEGVEILAGNRVPVGAEPLAMAYAGHQFGAFVPQLGDGRALLLGEVLDRRGVRHDIQLKGAGRTPFSRMGDGRAVLGPVLREYLLSEAMAALGVATTRSLAAVTTGAQVLRQGLKPGAVLTRVARSHIRIGTFQFFGRRGDIDGLRVLADYVLERLYPTPLHAAERYRRLLEAVIEGTASLVASWQLIGFIHGVMNTDNMSIAAETIDYGPCAFMDTYHPDTVYSSIDTLGRYAYANQPAVAYWNLARLADALLPLLDPDSKTSVAIAEQCLSAFPGHFEGAWLRGLRAKLGLVRECTDDPLLAQDLLRAMASQEADFTLTFRALCAARASGPEADAALRERFAEPAVLDAWAQRWRRRLLEERRGDEERQAAMRAVNPAIIPRNHLVEAALVAAEDHGDFQPFEELRAVLAKPYLDAPATARYALPPRPEEIVTATFCGT